MAATQIQSGSHRCTHTISLNSGLVILFSSLAHVHVVPMNEPIQSLLAIMSGSCLVFGVLGALVPDGLTPCGSPPSWVGRGAGPPALGTESAPTGAPGGEPEGRSQRPDEARAESVE